MGSVVTDVFNDWLYKFEILIGQYFGNHQYEFGHDYFDQGFTIRAEEASFQPQRIWFTVENVRDVSDDWSQINLAHVQLGPEEGQLIAMAQIQWASAKVSWFIHS